MKIACVPKGLHLSDQVDLQYVMFDRSTDIRVGEAGATLIKDLGREGIKAPQLAWDLLSIALAVTAADEGCSRRRTSSDGWTRNIELYVAVNNCSFWNSQRQSLENMLRFLTGDVWNLRFLDGGISAQTPKNKKTHNGDCACLLSGGVDSLIGAIDLTSQGLTPFFVSQVSKGDKFTQRKFATEASSGADHLQVNHNIHTPNVSERSQRSRSLLFITYGILASCSLKKYIDGQTVKLFIPENGFISLNIPLTPLRLGSLSTRTTHPYFLKHLQALLSAAAINVQLVNPYQFKTKGEMLTACQNQVLLKKLVFESTSCGRYARTGFEHCGRCVPCIVRRSAFNKWGENDRTSYRYKKLSIRNNKHRDFDDVRSAAFAIEQIRTRGLDRWVGGGLSSIRPEDPTPYQAVVGNGIKEIESFLRSAGVL